MRRLFTIILSVISVFAFASNDIENTNVCVFVNNNGTYVKAKSFLHNSENYDAKCGSIADICWQVSGYTSDEISIHFSNKNDAVVAYNIFNGKIICICFTSTSKDFNNYKKCAKLSQSVVDNSLEYIDCSRATAFLIFEKTLDNGIKNHSIFQSDVAKALNCKSSDTIIDNVKKIKYHFTNGVLTSYESLDKEIDYKEISKKYNSNERVNCSYEMESHLKKTIVL